MHCFLSCILFGIGENKTSIYFHDLKLISSLANDLFCNHKCCCFINIDIYELLFFIVSHKKKLCKLNSNKIQAFRSLFHKKNQYLHLTALACLYFPVKIQAAKTYSLPVIDRKTLR